MINRNPFFWTGLTVWEQLALLATSLLICFALSKFLGAK